MTEVSTLPSRDEIDEAMRDVVDPELGVNVVDLGLVYDARAESLDGQTLITIDMTLTSAGCPLTDVIEEQANSALTGGPKPLGDEMKINWVWIPAWGPEKITDDGREQLRSLGFNV
ncbi:MAG TPA: metal-sulfur cluster assembly factor [Jatrophihabitans sp.]|jgi:metal-sulfur cluster biosynthetic enzyme